MEAGACRGFPLALKDLKNNVDRVLPGLPKENPGSMWPKTTLAPLKDGRRLTPEQLKLLMDICKCVPHSLFFIIPCKQETSKSMQIFLLI